MFAYMNENGTIILNGDDDKLRGYSPENGITPVYFGLDESCGFHAENISGKGLNGTDAQFFTPNSSFTAHINIPGAHMVYNALAATAVGYALGMTDREICAGIEANVPIAGRNNLIRAPHFTIIDDCYNANPQAMEAALEILADTACRRRVAVLGDMGELGPISRDAHLQVGRTTARLGLDAVIAIGPKAAAIAQTAGPRAQHFAAIEEALPALRREFTPGTAVLVKASHAMHFGWIVEQLKQAYD